MYTAEITVTELHSESGIMNIMLCLIEQPSMHQQTNQTAVEKE